ncbi:MAG: hypothetical protein JOZ32_03175 [Bryobacterales bacterium]|nr:hypothetical protein [Bryobacterales bacterium]
MTTGHAESVQHFVARNPHQTYVAYNDIPKLAQLRKECPDLIKGGKQ